MSLAPFSPGLGGGLRRLAAYAADDARPLPLRIREKARACLLYALAVGVGGMRAPQPAQAARAMPAEPGGSATRYFDDGRSAPDRAAFANAVLFHARVQDDAHRAGHVGVVVVPAALAAADAVGASGSDLLSAIAAGYEVALRIGRDHAADLSTRGFRTTPVYGVFGAAAATARLRRLDPEATMHALALAANFAGGLREFAAAGSEDFPFQAGMAASNGVAAAALAAAGATGASSALEGAAGFFRAFGNDGVDYARRLTEGLGESYEIEGITFKPYPICQFHRGIVRGCTLLRERAEGAKLRSLCVRMNPFEADFYGVRYAGPFSTFPQTFMSAPFCAALAWTRGGATLAGLNDFTAPDILATIPRIAIGSDTARERYAPHLKAVLESGTELEWNEREGEGAYALTWDAAARMTATLCEEMRLPAADAERLIAAASGIDRAPETSSLSAAMRNACAGVRSMIGS